MAHVTYDIHFVFSSGKSSSSRRMTYTGPEVEFAAVAHCLVMLGRILCYKQGQALFPVTLRDRNGE